MGARFLSGAAVAVTCRARDGCDPMRMRLRAAGNDMTMREGSAAA